MAELKIDVGDNTKDSSHRLSVTLITDHRRNHVIEVNDWARLAARAGLLRCPPFVERLRVGSLVHHHSGRLLVAGFFWEEIILWEQRKSDTLERFELRPVDEEGARAVGVTLRALSEGGDVRVLRKADARLAWAVKAIAGGALRLAPQHSCNQIARVAAARAQLLDGLFFCWKP